MVDFLTYRTEFKEEMKPPQRVYARVDHVEPELDNGSENRTIYFECLDANWADNAGDGDFVLAAAADWPVSVVELRCPPWHALFRDFGNDDGAWAELRFDGGEQAVEHYLNLFEAPLIQPAQFQLLPRSFSRPFDLRMSMDSLDDASEQELKDALSGVGSFSGAAVYDVGQGNWNAVVDARYQPQLYFDFGCAVMGNRKSFPKGLKRCCVTHSPPVVLSHWDWDHWAFAMREASAAPLRLTWIVPRQKIGAVHKKFLARLAALGKVLIWPKALASIRVGGITIEQCTGAASERNHSGLAMTASANRDALLFPGDCRYDRIPSVGAGLFTSLVATHHGGALHSRTIPNSAGKSYSRLAYSYGRPNGYGHPVAATRTAHAAQWPNNLETAGRSRGPTVPDHCFMSLSGSPLAPPLLPACGAARCDLTLQLT